MAAQNYSNLKQDLIASIVQRELEFQAKLLPTVTNVSQFATKGAKSVSFPKLSSFTVNQRAFGAADTEQILADTTDQILLDKNKIISWIIDTKDEMQTTINAQSENAKRASAAIARKIDEDILAVLESDGIATSTTSVAITRDVILEMQEELFDNEAELDRLVLVVGNAQYSNLLKIAEFTEHQIYGPTNAISGGQVGTVYGMPVIRRSGVAEDRYYMYDSEGIGFAMQVGPQMDSEKDIQFGTGAMRFAMDALYGVDSLQRGEKSAGAGESALILKDANV